MSLMTELVSIIGSGSINLVMLTWINNESSFVEGTALPTTASNWTSMAYGNGKYVLLQNSGTYFYSTNGVSWVSNTFPTYANSIAYPNGLQNTVAFINNRFIVSTNLTFANYYSTDAINWTSSSELPKKLGWSGIAYSSQKFVMAANGAADCISSTDGNNWTLGALPASGDWRACVYGNGLFLMCNYNSSAYYTSTDAISWTSRTLPSSSQWIKAIYTGSVFVVFSSAGSNAVSTNGINWATGTAPGSASYSGIDYGNGLFVAVTSSNGVMATSTNAINWTQRTLPLSTDWTTVLYGNGIFVTLATRKYAVSTNGINWTHGYLPISGSFTLGVGLFNNGRFIVPTTSTYVLNSTNGTNWDSFSCSFGMSIGRIGMIGNKYVLLSNSTASYVLQSTDGCSWKTKDGFYSTKLNAKIFRNSTGEYVSFAGNLVCRSTDGVSWINHVVHPTSGLTWANGTCYNDTYVLSNSYDRAVSTDAVNWVQTSNSYPGKLQLSPVKAIVANGVISTFSAGTISMNSTDLINWVTGSPSISGTWSAYAYGNGKYVAARYSSADGFVSTDNINWTSVTLPISTWYGLTYGAGVFVMTVRNSQNVMYRSTDGVNWTSSTPYSMINNRGTAYDFGHIAYGSGTFVSVLLSAEVSGGNDTYTTSTDAVNWDIRTLPYRSSWSSITYQNGLFLLSGSIVNTVERANSCVLSSTNGIDWSKGTLPYSGVGCAPVYGNGVYVSTTSSWSYVSTDAINWNRSIYPFGVATGAYNLAFFNNQFVALTGQAPVVSTDGYSWALQTTNMMFDTPVITKLGSNYVAIPSNNAYSDKAYISTDSLNWNTTPIPIGRYNDIYADSTAVMALAYDKQSSIVSTDTINWAESTIPKNYWNTLTVDNGKYFLIGRANYVSSSTDLLSWNTVFNNTIGNYVGSISKVVYAGGKYFALPAEKCLFIAVSDDGKIWTTSLTNSNTVLDSIVYGNGFYASVPLNQNSIYYSRDGLGWYAIVHPFKNQDAGIANKLIFDPNSNKFVLVSNGILHGYAVTPDVEWTLGTYNITSTTSVPISQTARSWSFGIYGNGKYVFVASGNYSYCVSSTDGKLWLEGTSSVAVACNSITIGNGIFIMTRDSYNNYFTSTDAITWSSQRGLSQNLNYGFRPVVYGNGVYLGHDANGSISCTSTDCVSWTNRGMPVGAAWAVSVFGSGVFISMDGSGTSGNAYYTSTNAVNWTSRTFPLSAANKVLKVTRNTFTAIDVFLMVPSSTLTSSLMSTNGVNWSTLTSPMPLTDYGVYFGFDNGRYILASQTAVYSSTDAITWTLQDVGLSLGSIVTGNGGTLVTINNSSTSLLRYEKKPPRIDLLVYSDIGKYLGIDNSKLLNLYSTDAINWVKSNLTNTEAWESVAYGSGKWIAVPKYNKNTYYTSTDAINWTSGTVTALSSLTPISWKSLTYGGGGGWFVAVNSGTAIAAASTDGVNWAGRRLPSSQNWVKIACNGSLFMAIADSSANVAVSTDTFNWATKTLPAAIASPIIYAANGYFMVTGNTNNLYSSTDGNSWAAVTMAVTGQVWNSMGNNGNTLVVTSGSYSCLASTIPPTSFISGTLANSGGSLTFYSPFGWANIRNSSSTFNTSTNGVNWSSATTTMTNTTYAGGGYLNGQNLVLDIYGHINKQTSSTTWNFIKRLNYTDVTNWVDITYGNGKFVAIGHNNTANYKSPVAASSTDGINWVKSYMPSNYLSSVTYSKSQFVMLTKNDTASYISTNAVNWVSKTLPVMSDWNMVVPTSFGVLAVSNNEKLPITMNIA